MACCTTSLERTLSYDKYLFSVVCNVNCEAVRVAHCLLDNNKYTYISTWTILDCPICRTGWLSVMFDDGFKSRHINSFEPGRVDEWATCRCWSIGRAGRRRWCEGEASEGEVGLIGAAKECNSYNNLHLGRFLLLLTCYVFLSNFSSPQHHPLKSSRLQCLQYPYPRQWWWLKETVHSILSYKFVDVCNCVWNWAKRCIALN